ncbi:MAG TPA: DUF6286 domain-containing protein [Jiangellaceae bacterium]
MRAANRLLSLLLGLVLLLGGLLVAVEAVLAALGQASLLIPVDRWYEFLTETEVGDRGVLIVSLAVALLGLILVVAEMRRWPPTRLPVHLEAADGRWWVARRSAENRLESAAEDVTGVVGARAKLRARQGRWRIGVRVEAREGSRPVVEQAIEKTLERLSPPPDSSVRLRLVKPRRVA